MGFSFKSEPLLAERPTICPLVQGERLANFGGYIDAAGIENEFRQADLANIKQGLKEYLDGGNEELQIELGVNLELLGESDAALKELTVAEQKLPENALAPYALARVLMETNPAAAEPTDQQEGRWSVIVSHLRDTVQLDPDNIPAHYYLGNAIRKLVEEESYVDAVEVYTKYLAEAAPLGHVEEVQDFINEQDPGKQREAMFNMGKKEFSAGNYEKSIEAFTKAVELGEIAAFYHLGEVYEATGNNEKAVDAYRKALEVQGARDDIRLAFGRAVVKLFRKLSLLRKGLRCLKPQEERETPSLQSVYYASHHSIYEQGLEFFQLLNDHQAHQGAIRAAVFSPDGQTVLTGSADKTMQLWDLEGNMLKRFSGHSQSISSIAFSPDGETILAGTDDEIVKLWEVSGKELQVFNGHTSKVASVAFAPDEQVIMTGTEDGSVKLWNMKGEVKRTFAGHRRRVNSIVFSPDGKMVLTGSDDNTAKLWLPTGKLLHTFVDHTGGVNSVAFSPDGQLVVTASGAGQIKLWDLEGRMLRIIANRGKGVLSIVFSPDGQTVLTGDRDKKASLWSLSGDYIQAFSGHLGAVTSVAFSPDGQTVLTGSTDKTAKLWNLSGEVLTQYPLLALPNKVAVVN